MTTKKEKVRRSASYILRFIIPTNQSGLFGKPFAHLFVERFFYPETRVQFNKLLGRLQSGRQGVSHRRAN